MGFVDRLQHGWNAFMNKESDPTYQSVGPSYYYRPDRPRFTRGNERSIITAVFNRIAIDAAIIDLKHVKLDKNGKYVKDMDSGLNECLTLSANLDQTARAFKQDVVMSMLDEGCVAIVPVETTINPKVSGSYDITSMRTGRVVAWYPRHVKVRLYNENTGKNVERVFPKEMVAIVENPLYSVVNEPNSTVQRLIRKLNILDAIDEQSGSGKLDLIIQLPYVVKSTTRKEQAKERIQSIEQQLSGSKYGVAYTDGTERITQLNRPVENNLLKQVEYLTNMAYSQLGITTSIMDRSADEKTMLNYMSRTVEPIVSAFVDEMKRKFITKTGRTQGQSIFMFRSPFKLVPASEFADIASKLISCEIMSPNEGRQEIGFKPSSDPRADELINRNINSKDSTPHTEKKPVIIEDANTEEEENQNGL